MKVSGLVVSCALVASLGLFGMIGCSSGSSSSSESAGSDTSSALEVSEQAKPEYEIVGKKVDGVASFAFTNKAGSEIKAIAIKSTGSSEYSENLLAGGKKIADGDTVLLYCPSIEAANSGEADVKLNDMADIRIELADGRTFELHQVAVNNVADAAVCLAEEIAYLEYTGKSDGATASTLESEKAIAEVSQSVWNRFRQQHCRGGS